MILGLNETTSGSTFSWDVDVDEVSLLEEEEEGGWERLKDELGVFKDCE